MKPVSLMIPEKLPYSADDQRLTVASALGVLLPALFLGLVWSQSWHPLWKSILANNLGQKQLQNDQSRIYPVIIEQAMQKPEKTDQYRALAEYNAAGRGGITTTYGFHTLSDTDILSLTSQAEQGTQQSSLASNNHSTSRYETDLAESAPTPDNKTSSNTSQNSGPVQKGMYLKVPANYRFEQHMVLRYSGGALSAIATARMPGADYFRNMIRQIKLTFAPPGQNYIIRDQFGYSLNQAIQPQVVKIQFVINRDGTVTDVKKVASLGQTKVDQACIEVLSNKNFGKPPPEIFERGNVFGINFVFPDLRQFK